jgi:hypothetical protein
MKSPALSLQDSADRLEGQRALFLADFAGGRIGERHNLYQHRARLIRQLAARCG